MLDHNFTDGLVASITSPLPIQLRLLYYSYMPFFWQVVSVDVTMEFPGATKAEACCGLEFDDDEGDEETGAPLVHIVPLRFITLRE